MERHVAFSAIRNAFVNTREARKQTSNAILRGSRELSFTRERCISCKRRCRRDSGHKFTRNHIRLILQKKN